jgi:TonB-dependent receptor
VARDTILKTGNITNANPFLLQPTVSDIEKVTVLGNRNGQAGALNKQKNADNLKNMLAAELIEKLPDLSAADALQRVPGVSLQREQGEGRYIQIRGTEPRLSTVTINGQSIASPDGKTRATGLNVIPSDQLAEIEVSKVLTPEMDGDAIGGTVNLVTSTARDKNLNVKLNLMPGYSALSNSPIWQGSASVGKRFLKKDALGFIAGASYYKNVKETDAIAMHWDTTVYKTIVLDTSIKAYDYLTNLQLRQSDKTNERIGISGKIDYRFNPVTNAFFSTSYNNFATQEYRRSLAFAIIGNDSRPEASNFYVVRDVPVTWSLRDRYKEQNITSLTLGGSTKLLDLKLDGSVTYADAKNKEPDRVDISFGSKFGIKYSVQDPDNPAYFPFNIPTYNSTKFSGNPEFKYETKFDDPTSATTGGIKIENKNANEKTISVQINAMIPLNLFSQTIETKVGIKATEHIKDQTVTYTKFISSTGTRVSYPNLSYFLDDYSNNHFFNGQYTLKMMPDPKKVRSYFFPTPAGLMPDTTLKSNSPDPETYTAKDKNGAGYLQTKLKMGSCLFVGGVRVEYTSMKYVGYTDSLLYNTYVLTHPVEMYKNFMFALPMILWKYSLTKDINIRTSFTRSFARPDWYDLVPHSIESFDDATGTTTIEKGNPDLKPTTSSNIDISLEYYNSSKSLISVSGYYKGMQNYIFSVSNDNQAIGSKEIKTTFTKGNGKTADLAGVELSLQQQFSAAAKIFEGLGINGNYTYTWSKTRVPGFSKDSPLPGQSEHVGNAAVFYENFGFGARIALNLQSHFITEISSYTNNFSGEVLFQNTYVDDHAQLDCSVSQKIGKHVTVVLEASNLTNEPYKIYLGDTRHTVQKEYYGWSGQAGVRLNF